MPFRQRQEGKAGLVMTYANISVVIPVHNGELHLVEAVESALRQTLAPRTIIVVDDGSEDETPAVAARFGDKIQYLRRQHNGAASARNAGALRVETEHISFLDSDDIWTPDKLENQCVALRAAKATTMIFGHLIQFASPELRTEEVARLMFNASPMPALSACALLMRTVDFHAVGLFDESLSTGEFIEWYARAQAAGLATVVLPEVVLRRRLHRGNHGIRSAHTRIDYVRAMKAVLDRRREHS
jgi:glycosyltransferase involved in cell wall biosynthesis